MLSFLCEITFSREKTERAYVPGEILVKYKKGVTKSLEKEFNKKFAAANIQEFPSVGIYNLEVAPSSSVEETLKALLADPNVEFAEPNYIVYAVDTPTDPFFSSQWSLHNTGQTGGTYDADIDATEAWSIQTGDNSVVIAVIDSGVDYTHEDLSSNIWINPDEIPNDGIDNDGNGYIDDSLGWDFYNNDNDPMDDSGHGTHVAGTIAAAGDNGIGIAGVNWTARIMPLKFIGDGGWGTTADAISAIDYAVAMGAHVMNNSWGGSYFSQALKDAIVASDTAGLVFVAAAGNYGTNNDVIPFYPSAYDLPNIISVAATDHNDATATFSNYGPLSVDIAAPGVNIISTLPGDTYGSLSGTSMASPYVAGLAGLLIATFPFLTNHEVKTNILSNSDSLSALSGKVLSEGRINAYDSLNCSDTQLFVFINSPEDNYAISMGTPVNVRASVTHGCGPVITGATVTARFSNGDPDIILYDDASHGDEIGGDGIYSNNWAPGSQGSIIVTVNANKTGFTGGSEEVTVTSICPYNYDDTISYDWIDATSGTDTGISADDGYATINIGFDFTFYGNTYSSATVSANGYITFASSGSDYYNDPIPNAANPNSIIAPFWDDLYPPDGWAIYYLLQGVAPNRQLTIEWHQIPHYGYRSDTVTFEATLYESTNEIVYRYKDVSFGKATFDYGGSATVGIENALGSEGLEYSFNSASLFDSLAVRFYPSCSPPSAPSGLAASTRSTSLINLVWTNNSSSELGNKIERKVGPDGLYSEIATVSANVNRYSDPGLSKGTMYYYRVRSYNTAGSSPYSNETSTLTFESGEDNSTTSSSGGSGSPNCFIATAAFGSYLDPNVKVLRKFRDDYLLTNALGKTFVNLYYELSPPLANYISEHETFRTMTRWTLTPLIYGVKYSGGAFMILIGFILIPVVWRRRKKMCN